MKSFIIKPDVPVVNLQMTVSAMLAQAVEDYKALEAHGFIDHGKVVMDKMQRANRSGKLYMTHQVNELLYFFTSKLLDEWIETAALTISPHRIRKELGIV